MTTIDDDTEHESPPPLAVPDEVHSQLEALKESGEVNMMMEIYSGLREMGFDEALAFVEEHQQEYYEHALRGGFVPESEAGDDADRITEDDDD